MKNTRLIIAAVLAATLPLQSSCATAQTIGRVVAVAQQPADRIFHTLADEKAYYGLLRFEQAANQVASAAVDMGFLRAGSPQAIRVADLLRTLTGIVQAAQQAKRLNDAAGVMQKINEGKALYTQIMHLLGR